MTDSGAVPPVADGGSGQDGRARRTFVMKRFAVGFAAGAMLGVLLLALWYGVTGALAARDAQDLRASASRLQAAAEAQAFGEVAAELPQASQSAGGLDDRLSSAPWSWAQGFPIVGASLTSVAVLADATAGVLENTQDLEAVLSSLGDETADAPASASIAQASQGAADAATVAAQYLDAVRAVDPQSVLSPLRSPIGEARRQVLEALEPLAEAAPLAQVLPDLFGINRPVTWLVVLGQPAESRGSGGGFIGAYASLTVDEGVFGLVERATDNTVASVQQDTSWLPAEYRRLWGSDAAYLWGLNESRHFPYAAEAAQRAVDPDADYVVSLTPRAVSALLTISGPITVEGSTVDAATADAFFSRDIYIRYPDVAVKDRVTLQFVTELFRVLGAQSLEPRLWWEALSPLYEGQSIEVWAADPATQELVEDTPLGGVVPNGPEPWVTAAFNNGSATKSDSFLKTSLEYRSWGDCQAGEVKGSLTAVLVMEAMPPGLPFYISGYGSVTGAPYGSTANVVSLYGPSGAIGVDSVLVNGQPVAATAGMERGHPVWRVKVELEPGAPVTVQVNFRQPPFPGQPLVVEPQAMVQDTAVSVVDERTCAVGSG